MLEAVTQAVVDDTRVLLVSYDAQYPPPLFAKRPIPEAFGVAFVLSPDGSGTAPSLSLAKLTVSITDGDARADEMADSALERLRRGVPAARSLPLLRQLALHQAGTVNVDYLDGRCLTVKVELCD